jgi:hypothetical protein
MVACRSDRVRRLQSYTFVRERKRSRSANQRSPDVVFERATGKHDLTSAMKCAALAESVGLCFLSPVCFTDENLLPG